MKYLRTFHLPSSENLQNDDRKMETTEFIVGQDVVITEKLDGEGDSLLKDKFHARSEDGVYKPWQSYVKSIWGGIKYQIPDNIQICGENLQAAHSIFYDRLTSYFYVYNIIDLDRKVLLSVDETMNWCKKLDLKYVPILFSGIYDGNFIMPEKSCFGDTIEGYVVRIKKEIPIDQFGQLCGKWVRKNHVRTNDRWETNWKPNKLGL